MIPFTLSTNIIDYDENKIQTGCNLPGCLSISQLLHTILEDGSIEFKGWTLWYSGYTYVSKAVSVLSR